MPTTLENLGKRIAHLRGRRSQRIIAKAADVDVSTISRIERGIHDPSFTTVGAIALALGVSYETLIGVEKPNITPPGYVDETESLEPTAQEVLDQVLPLVEQVRAIESALRELLDHVELSQGARRTIQAKLEFRKSA